MHLECVTLTDKGQTFVSDQYDVDTTSNTLSYLTFNDIMLTPLDAQMGQWPMRGVPDVLLPYFFGNVELSTYVILHPQDLPGGVEYIESSGLPFECLFRGRAAYDRRDEAPFIIKLLPDAAFTRKLFTDAEAAQGLWGKTAAMVVTTPASLQDTSKHFRRFTRFSDENGKWFHLRFWDGALFIDYWKYFAASWERVARFFYTRDHGVPFTFYMQTQAGLVRIEPTVNPGATQLRTVTPFAFDANDHGFFEAKIDQRIQASVIEDLDKRLASAPEHVRNHIEKAVSYCFAFIRSQSRGRPVSANDCTTLAFLVLMWDALTVDILAGPVFSEQLSPIGHRIELAKMSYFESLDHLNKREM